jgi:LiaF transmembrane domain
MSSRIDSRVVAGLALIALGVVLTELSFSTHQSWSVQRFWPMLVVAFGVSRIVERPTRLAGFVLLIVGCGVQLSNIGLYVLPERQVVRFWPLAVVLVGLWLVLSGVAAAKIEGFAILFLGAWLQLSYFGGPHIGSYRVWPLGLAVIGGWIVSRSFSIRRSP